MITVVGAGVAGLSAVQQLASAGQRVRLVTAGRFGSDSIAAGNTALAQGGIAAALGPGDTAEAHAADTVAAGAGLVNPAVAHLLAVDGIRQVTALVEAGFPADRTATGELSFGLEAAHRAARVLHAGEDSTGAALSRFLTAEVQRLISAGVVQLVDEATLLDFSLENGRITGYHIATPAGVRHQEAATVILATGGFAGLYPTSSASPAVTGEGLLAAAGAGAVLADMEFVQFHPTVVPTTGDLISEAVRGAGAVLRDANGTRFMPAVHPSADLAPRDVVSRASVEVMANQQTDSVWLDATGIEARHGPGTLATRFPVLTAALAAQGIDWTRQYVPVAPAAHYCMGGVATDTCGRTSVPGLFAVGEVAATGVHGANRLASNSLLEGLVFGARAAQAAGVDATLDHWRLDPDFAQLTATAATMTVDRPSIERAPGTATKQYRRLQQLTDQYLGITRNGPGLRSLLDAVASLGHPAATVATIMATAALARKESRGGHWRADYPTTNPRYATSTAWRLHPTPPSSVAYLAGMRTQEQL